MEKSRKKSELKSSKISTPTEKKEFLRPEENLTVVQEKQGKHLIAVPDIGFIDLAFPEADENFEFEGFKGFSPSYYTLSAKERLLLLFAENFRRQFLVNYPNRMPLVLAVKNECDVEKFVCTTIRPTAFLFPKLIGSLEECCKFVADFIDYEPLENPTALPTRLISPDTLLKRRKGNCLEMATLLCSMLTGAGFAAMVVSGYATREITLNDQSDVVCPFIPDETLEDSEVVLQPKVPNKYSLRAPPDLRSRFVMEIEEKISQQEEEERQRKLEAEEKLQEELERKPDDEFANRRIHAWIVVIENAPWCYKPTPIIQTSSDDEDSPIIQTAFFIEPSTGFRHEVTTKKYLCIDSVWNQFNYFVNRQSCESGLADLRWNLANFDDWEYFLPGEPHELFAEKQSSDEADPSIENDLALEKRIDMLPSWVQKLYIGAKDFEQRYPIQKKSVHYKKAIYHRYSPYYNRDGLLSKLILFEDNQYEVPTIQWEWFKNRKDFLYLIRKDNQTNQIEESFNRGREDCLKYYVHNTSPSMPKLFHFYYQSRLDSLKLLELLNNKIILHFGKRDDLCYYLEFQIEEGSVALELKNLTQIIEKCHRNEKLPSNRDICVRQFSLQQNKMLLKYHYAKDAITASMREFKKPPKSNYGQEIGFDPALTTSYSANPLDKMPSQVELYTLLLAELGREEKLKKAFEKRCDEINDILERRKLELSEPKLIISIFDPLRNDAARKFRLDLFEDGKKQKELAAAHDADFLGPYLVPHKSIPLNETDSKAAYDSCLHDVKTRYVGLLNDLQRRYEDLTSESSAIKNFLDKFHDQFGDFDYERLLKEEKDIELNRRMVQQRLILTHDEAQQKYDKIKESLLNDKRLNLNDP